MTQIRIGESLTSLKLTNLYDRHAASLLTGKYLERLPRQKRQMSRFQIVQRLPSSEEYRSLRDRRFTQSLESLIHDAFSQLETLADELQEAFDATPENLQGSPRAEALEENATALYDLDTSAQDWFDEAWKQEIAKLPVLHLPSPNCDRTRSNRRDEAVAMIESAIAEVQDILDRGDEEQTYSHSQQEALQELVNALETVKDEAEAVEFPAAFGS